MAPAYPLALNWHPVRRLTTVVRSGLVARLLLTWADGTHETVSFVASAMDLSVVDALARLQLSLRRSGGDLSVEQATAPLAELLELAGLREQLCGQVGGQVHGQAERNEETPSPETLSPETLWPETLWTGEVDGPDTVA